MRSELFAEPFFDAMTAAGQRVAGDPRQLFDRQAESASARFLVGAQITSMQFYLDQIDWAFTGPSSKGTGNIEVTWQVYSLRDRRVIYETTTPGQSELHRPGFVGSSTGLILDAFSSAATRLAADPRFRAAVGSGDTAGTAIPASLGPAGATFEVPRFTAFTGSANSRLAQLRVSAVTIVLGRGHGSGFFISDDGLILTNRHVVGDAETVNVRLLVGVEVVGRVLARHAARDVALVKVDLTRTQPLPFRLDPPRVGEEVYAIGAPIETRLAGSVTRGIVSAVRRELRGGVELGMIQSDAAIQGGNSGGPLLDASGNVIGIAVEGHGQMNSGLNFFVPIDEALRYLNIRLGQPRELRF